MSSIKNSFEHPILFDQSCIFNINCFSGPGLAALTAATPSEENDVSMKNLYWVVCQQPNCDTHKPPSPPTTGLMHSPEDVKNCDTVEGAGGEPSLYLSSEKEEGLCRPHVREEPRRCWWTMPTRHKAEGGRRSERTDLWWLLAAATAKTPTKCSSSDAHTCSRVLHRHWIPASSRPWPLTSLWRRGIYFFKQKWKKTVMVMAVICNMSHNFSLECLH